MSATAAVVGAAERALTQGEWPRMSATQRGPSLWRLRDLMIANVDRLAAIEQRDNGKIIAEASAQIRYMGDYFKYYGGLADKVQGAVIPTDNFTAAPSGRSLTREVEAALRSKPAAEWEMILIAIGIPAGRVVTVREALQNPQVKHRELLQGFDTVPGVDRPISVTRAGFKISGANPAAKSPPAATGRTHRRGSSRFGLQPRRNRGFA